MYAKAINYKGMWLAPGSEAARLHDEKKFKELDAHLKAIQENERKLLANIK